MLPYSFKLTWACTSEPVHCSVGCKVNTYSSDDFFIVFSGHLAGFREPVQKILDYYSKRVKTEGFSPGYGQFVCVVVDYRKKMLSLFADPSGIRSLYYRHLSPNGIEVASLVSALVVNPKLQRSQSNECHLLRYGYLPKGKTVFKDVSEVSPGSYLDLTPDKLGDGGQHNYSDIDYSFRQYSIESLYDVLNQSMMEQLDGFSSAGVLLGGFDSALIASLLKRQGCRVKTYSFSYDNDAYNQPFVDELAEWLGIEHKWVPVKSSDILQGLKSYASYCSIPTLWPGYIIQTKKICEQLSEDNIEICFSGDGCDTAFMGYPSTYRRGSFYKSFPHISGKVAGRIITLLDRLGFEYVLGHIQRVLLALLRASCFAVDERPLRSFQVFDPTCYRRLTGETGTYNDSDEYIGETSKGHKSLSFERNMYQAKTLFSPNRAKLMSAAEVSGIPIYSPYMHPMLKAFAATVPDHVLRPCGDDAAKEGKQILMDMAEDVGLLPKEIIRQPKLAAINSPIDVWIAGEIRGQVQALCRQLPFAVNEKYIRSLCSDLPIEKLYKARFSDDGVVSLAIGLLATYASFFSTH